MNGSITFEEMWEDLKGQDDDVKSVLEVSETVGAIIQSITNARISQGISQRELAERCGVKQSAIARMERLQVMPRLDTVAKVARALGLCVYTEKVYSEVAVTENTPVSISTRTCEQTRDDNGGFRYRTLKRGLGMVAAAL